jgi:glycosyltransferase involved in cell wall biosynthesis
MDYPNAIVKEQDSGHEPRLVTFIVFAYNQEKLIREAVESAFAQTYEPLEIVLSDDCSADRTFEIMCEMAAAYEGPHTVRVVQNPRNLGVLGHAIARGKDAAGEIVVGAAGDDVSEPERTAMTVDAFGAGGNVGAVFSWVSVIDESGKIIGSLDEGVVTAAWARGGIYLRDDRRNTTIRGCSAGYRKWVFDVPITSAASGSAEDAIFSFYVNLLGADIITLKPRLVRYRRHSGSVMNFSHPSAADNEVKRCRDAKSQIAYLDEITRIASELDRVDLLDKAELDRARTYLRDIVEWPEISFFQRFSRALTGDYRGEWMPTLKMLTWRMARLWGKYPVYQPKMSLARLQRRYR